MSMTRTTRPQREALKRVYDRAPVYATREDATKRSPLTYRQFRKQAQPTFGMDDAIVIRWAGMWLAIETDGYTHS
jgi:hypothetical protein